MHKTTNQSLAGLGSCGTIPNTPTGRTAMHEQAMQSYCNTLGAEIPRLAEVPEWIGNLEESLSCLEQAFAEHVSKLGSVSRDPNMQANATSVAKSEPETWLVPIADTLRSKVKRIQFVTESLANATRNLEL